MCEHPINLLVGSAEGIKCEGCGKIFESFEDLEKSKSSKEKKEEKNERV